MVVRVQMGDDDGVGAGAVAVGAADEDVIDAVAQSLGLLGRDILVFFGRLFRFFLLRRHRNDGGLRRFRPGGRRLRCRDCRALHRLYEQLPRRKCAAGEQQHNGRNQNRRARAARKGAFFRMRRVAAIAK